MTNLGSRVDGGRRDHLDHLGGRSAVARRRWLQVDAFDEYESPATRRGVVGAWYFHAVAVPARVELSSGRARRRARMTIAIQRSYPPATPADQARQLMATDPHPHPALLSTPKRGNTHPEQEPQC